MNRSLAMAFAYASVVGSGLPRKKMRTPIQKEPRPCVNCGTLHTHNNCYCSAGCCFQHRGKLRAERLNSSGGK